MNEIQDENIAFLMKYCSEIPTLYNQVANDLYEKFHVRSAELSLLVTYYINEERKPVIQIVEKEG